MSIHLDMCLYLYWSRWLLRRRCCVRSQRDCVITGILLVCVRKPVLQDPRVEETHTQLSNPSRLFPFFLPIKTFLRIRFAEKVQCNVEQIPCKLLFVSTSSMTTLYNCTLQKPIVMLRYISNLCLKSHQQFNPKQFSTPRLPSGKW